MIRTVGAIGMPVIGLGTWRSNGQEATDTVKKALELGYRHIDTAQRYENEQAVGAGIKASSVAREDIFLTTKIYPPQHAAKDLLAAIERSLLDLQTDYVDLLLLHWPSPDVPLAESFEALNLLRERGLAKHIGVSNFTVKLLKQAQAVSEAPIVVNQVEYHPFIVQSNLLKYMDANDIILTAYAPVARGKVFDHPLLVEMAKEYQTTPAVISLAWIIARDNRSAIPKTVTEQYLQENLSAAELTLSAADIAKIDGIAKPGQRMIDHRSYTPEWDD